MKLTIDGREVIAAEGETILECARRHDIAIPHLCTHSVLAPFGACRMCLVEIEGLRGYPSSCTTPAAEGMVVRTSTEKLQDLRRKILQLILLEHPSACLLCEKQELCEKYRPQPEKAGRTTGCHTCNNKEVCEVRALAAQLQVADLPVPPFYRDLPLRRSDPFMDRDLNLCILCGRCVRICKHYHGGAIIDFVNRGEKTHIGEAFGRPLLAAGCKFCGACVDACPTGSLADRYAKWHGEPEKIVATTCIFCPEACALRVGVVRGRVIRAQAASDRAPLCVLGRFALPEFHNAPDRLRAPVVRAGKVLREVSWESALAFAAEKLRPFVGDGFALVAESTGSLEDRHVFRKFTEEVMKSPHYLEIQPDARGVASADLPPGIRAALLAGDFVAPARLEGLEALLVLDCYPTPASTRADAVFPAAIFAETEGTWADGTGRRRPLRVCGAPPGQARPDWRVISDLGRALGAPGFAYESAGAIAAEIGLDGAELRLEHDQIPLAAKEPQARRTHFRGRRLDEKVRGLRELPQ